MEREVKRWQDLCDELPTSENLTGLEETRIRYEFAYDYVTQGAIIRSRARWFEKGEKSNSYFLRLENQNNSSSCIRKLKLDDDLVIADPVEILGEIKSFYSNLYQSHGSNHESDISARFLENPSIPKLDEDKKELCEGRLTYNECYRSLLTFQIGKAPGNDGLTVEFYKVFWLLLGNLVVDCLNEAYDYGELSTSQKMAMIKLIEKKGKDKMHIKNWRPISLLNVDAKIASKALAKRLETVLPLIIHGNQCAYVKGRSIFDCTRIIDDIMFYTKEKNLSGLLLAIDFEKAFDSLDWTFLNKALSAFNFGQSLKKKLNLWKWRNLTVLGRVQIVKTFAISKLLYRASQLPLSSEIIKSANKIIYDFIWKGKDKVKRRALINNIENGGLKMIHLESLIQSQKMSFFKRYLDPEYVADWKIVLDTLLMPVGGPISFKVQF